MRVPDRAAGQRHEHEAARLRCAPHAALGRPPQCPLPASPGCRWLRSKANIPLPFRLYKATSRKGSRTTVVIANSVFNRGASLDAAWLNFTDPAATWCYTRWRYAGKPISESPYRPRLSGPGRALPNGELLQRRSPPPGSTRRPTEPQNPPFFSPQGCPARCHVGTRWRRPLFPRPNPRGGRAGPPRSGRVPGRPRRPRRCAEPRPRRHAGGAAGGKRVRPRAPPGSALPAPAPGSAEPANFPPPAARPAAAAPSRPGPRTYAALPQGRDGAGRRGWGRCGDSGPACPAAEAPPRWLRVCVRGGAARRRPASRPPPASPPGCWHRAALSHDAAPLALPGSPGRRGERWEGHGGERGRAAPARGVEAPPRAEASQRAQTAGHALTARRPPCLPGADGPAQTLIIPSSPGRGGERSGAGPPPADKPARPAAAPRPAVRQRRAPGTRLAAHPVPSLRAHPGRPAAAKQQQHPAPGGQEGRCSLWGAAAELPPPAGAGRGSGEVRGCPRRAPARREGRGGEWRGGPRRGEGRRPGGQAGGRGVGPPPPGLAARPARLLEARAGVFRTAAVGPSRPAALAAPLTAPPQHRGRHRPRVRCSAGQPPARPRSGSSGSGERPPGSGTRAASWKRNPSQHGACRSGRGSARTDRKRRPLVAVATCGLPLENCFKKVISGCCLSSLESSAANALHKILM